MIMSRTSKILTANRDGLCWSRLLLGLALLVLSGIFTPAEAQFSNGYSYRVEVDFVDAEVIGGPHTNFPVLISSTLLDLRTVGNGGKVEDANGYDIIFTSDAAGTTPLAHEIESYVSSTGEIVFWVRVESLAATTKIYMFYGNSGIATFQGDVTSNGVTGVWDANYKGVYHLNELQAAGTHVDATGTNIDATRVGNTSGTGQIDGGQLFDGNDYIVAGGLNDDIDVAKGTVSAWIELNTETGDSTVFGTKADSTNKHKMNWDNGASEFLFRVEAGGTNSQVAIAGGAILDEGDGKQHLVTMTWDKNAGATGEMKAFIDGSQVGTTQTGLGVWVGAIADSVAIGATGSAGHSAYWLGMIDEVRVSSSVRAPQWIETGFNNQLAPAAFYALGPEITDLDISGRVFEDGDFTGTASTWDGGTNDLALANVDVELYTSADVYQSSTTTDINGNYSFLALAVELVVTSFGLISATVEVTAYTTGSVVVTVQLLLSPASPSPSPSVVDWAAVPGSADVGEPSA